MKEVLAMLNESQARTAQPKEKSFMLRDDRGLYLRVDPSGRKYWIFRYWENKKEHRISLGPYPDLSLKDARLQRDELQTARAKGENISIQSKNLRLFSGVAAEWLSIHMKGKAETYVESVRQRLSKYILPAGQQHLLFMTENDV